MRIGAKLYELRKKKGFSQEEVADRLNVSRQTVSKWETDQSVPDFDKIVPICELYSITADELLMGIKKEKEHEMKEEIILEKKEDIRDKKRALGIGLSVLIYFIAIIWIMIAIPVKRMNPVLASAQFLFICGIATFIIIYTTIVYKKEKKKEEEKINNPTKELVKQINNIISIFFSVIYLSISFLTGAWHITWILWVIYACIAEIVKLIFMLGGDSNEK